MEESKAAAYYEELTRKGEGAARFKQGLGFGAGGSSSSNKHDDGDGHVRGSALPSSSSFLSSFVRASSPSKASELEKQSQLSSIQNKLKKKPDSKSSPGRVSDRRDEVKDRDRDRDRERHRRRRSRSRSRESESRHRRRRSTSRERDRRRRRRSSRSMSPHCRRSGRDAEKEKKKEKVDYARVIEGYEKMTPAERVKAKMKLQLDETAEKDETKGKGSGWERFEFDKDAPLDDEEIEAVEDDVALVKRIGQSFRYSTVEERKAEEIKTAHDEAIFGGALAHHRPPPNVSDDEPEAEDRNQVGKRADLPSSLVSEKVLAKQQGSWRDRVRKA